jgi:hypothetical protein
MQRDSDARWLVVARTVAAVAVVAIALVVTLGTDTRLVRG